MLVPIAPSKITTRSCIALRYSLMYSVDRYKTRVRARLQSCRNASFYCHPEGLQPRGICFSGATSHSCRVPHSCPRILRTGWASHAEIVAVITVSYPGAPLLSAHFADRVGFTRCWNNRLHYRFVSGGGFSRTATASFYCHPEGLPPPGTCLSPPSQYRRFLPASPAFPLHPSIVASSLTPQTNDTEPLLCSLFRASSLLKCERPRTPSRPSRIQLRTATSPAAHPLPTLSAPASASGGPFLRCCKSGSLPCAPEPPIATAPCDTPGCWRCSWPARNRVRG